MPTRSHATRRGHFMGWHRDAPDPFYRDHFYSAPQATIAEALAKPSFSLRKSPFNPAIYDQGEIGSCTCNAVARLVQFARRESKEAPDFMPSRLLMYYDVRQMENSILYDAGAQLRDVISTLAKLGVCDEKEWAYDIDAADPQTGLFPAGSHEVTKPPPNVYTDARKHVPITYSRVMQNLAQMKGCLADGFPFTFGFTVYSSIYDANGNPVVNLPMPTMQDEVEGAHAITAVGWDDNRPMPGGLKGALEIANSWGPNVMDDGYLWMPYPFATNNQLASDFWTIRKVSA